MINATKVWGGAGAMSQNSFGMIAFRTVSGGAGAALTGGNFWQGAVTGLVVSGLNHAMHKMGDESMYDEAEQGDQEDPPAKKPSLEDLKKIHQNIQIIRLLKVEIEELIIQEVKGGLIEMGVLGFQMITMEHTLHIGMYNQKKDLVMKQNILCLW